MQEVEVLVFPANPGQKSYQLLQYSKYDTIEDLFARILDSIDTRYFQIWNTNKPSKSSLSFISSLNNQFAATQTVVVEGEEIKSSRDCIMTLGLGYKSLLIVEKLCGKPLHFCFISSKLKNSNLKRESKSEFGQRYKIENEKYESNKEENYYSNIALTPVKSIRIKKLRLKKFGYQSDEKISSSRENNMKSDNIFQK